VLQKQHGAWRIRFLHGTRVPSSIAHVTTFHAAAPDRVRFRAL
jgi:hypothetical protein